MTLPSTGKQWSRTIAATEANGLTYYITEIRMGSEADLRLKRIEAKLDQVLTLLSDLEPPQ
jgi:hypothetical protein